MPGYPFESKARERYEPSLPEASTVWMVEATAPDAWYTHTGEDKTRQATKTKRVSENFLLQFEADFPIGFQTPSELKILGANRGVKSIFVKVSILCLVKVSELNRIFIDHQEIWGFKVHITLQIDA